MPVETCPSPADWNHWLDGQLNEVRSVELEQHLLSCVHCLEQVRAHSPSVELVRSLGAEAWFAPGERFSLARILERAKSRRGEAAAFDPATGPIPGSDATLVGNVPVARNADATLRDPGANSPPAEEAARPEARSRHDSDLRGKSQQPTARDEKLATPSEKELEPGLVLGAYKIVRKLGQGGMGMVFLAEHLRMRRLVALKVLPPSVTRNVLATQRFQREVQAMARLSHPNVVTAYDADEARGLHFLVMEYVEGQDLSALVKECGPLPVEQALDYIVQGARGLEYAHTRGLVHRDIKPSNFLVDAAGRVKILDLGLARFSEEPEGEEGPAFDLTGTGVVVGTVDYMSPEQAESTKTADARADIYSLGCTLWFLLTGKSVYGGANVLERLLAHRNAPIPSLREAVPGLSPVVAEDVERVFTKMVAKRKEERYQTVADVVADLRRIAPGGTAVEEPRFAPTRPSPENGPQPRTVASVERSGNGGLPRVLFVAGLAAVAVAGGWKLWTALPQPETPPVVTRKNGPKTVNPPAPSEIVDTPQAMTESPVAGSTDEGSSGTTHEVEKSIASATSKTEKNASDPHLGETVPDREKLSEPVGEPLASAAPNRPAPGRPAPSRPAPDKPASGKSAVDTTPPDKADPGPVEEVLGTWTPGLFAGWMSDPAGSEYTTDSALPGLADTPRLISGLRRWNVETVVPRGAVTVLRHSPDGKWVAVGSADGPVRLFDSTTHTLSRLWPGIAGRDGVIDVAWRPDSTGLAFVADDRRAVRIVSLAGGADRSLWRNGRLSSVAWNSDGSRLAIGFAVDRHNAAPLAVEIVDAKGELVRELPQGNGVDAVVEPGHLRWLGTNSLAVAHADGALRLWDIAKGTSRVLDTTGRVPAQGLAVNQNGELAISTEKEIRLLGSDGKLLRSLSLEEVGSASVAWDHTGRLVAGGREPVRVWDRDSGSVRDQFATPSVCVDWNPEGSRLLVAGRGVTELEWTQPPLKGSTKGKKTGWSLPAERSVGGVVWNADGTILAAFAGPSGSSTESVLMWRESGPLVETFPVDPAVKGPVAWNAAGTELLGYGRSSEGSIVVVSAALGQPAQELWRGRVDQTESPVGPPAMSVDGRFIAVPLGKNRAVQILEAAGTPLARASTDPLVADHVVWNPRNHRLAVLSSRQQLGFIEPDTWGFRVAPRGQTGEIASPPRWRPDGLVLSFESSQPARNWFDLAGNPLDAAAPRVNAVAWRSDGKRFVSGVVAGSTEFRLRADTGASLTQRFVNGTVECADWLPEGTWIATGSRQSTVTVWREWDLSPRRVSVLLSDGRSLTLTPAGEVLADKPDEWDAELVYVVEREEGRVETLTPAQFRELVEKGDSETQ